jgi:hypothetical protein
LCNATFKQIPLTPAEYIVSFKRIIVFPNVTQMEVKGVPPIFRSLRQPLLGIKVSEGERKEKKGHS